MTLVARPDVPPSLRPSPLRTALRLAADPSRWRPHLDFDPEHVYSPRLEVQHDYVSDDGILRLVATRHEGEDW